MRAIGNITASIAVAAVAILSVSTYSPQQSGRSPQSPLSQGRFATVSLSSTPLAGKTPSARSNDDLWVQCAIAAIALGSFAIGSARKHKSSELRSQ